MRTRLAIFLCAIAALIAAGCSSTTVVARDERATADETTDVSDSDTSSPGAEDEDERAEDDDEAEPDDEPTEVELGDGSGFGLGGADQLDALLADCEDGSDLACDVLFQISAFNSPEEDAAVTCGGRSDDAVTFCTEGVDALADELVFDPDSEAIDDIESLCVDDGDMTACDFLYYRSPIDSEMQEVGGTCGGRVAVAVPDCRTLLADS